MMQKKVQRVFYALLVIVCCSVMSKAADDNKTENDKKPKFELQNITVKGFDLSSKTAAVVASVAVKNTGGALKLQNVKYKLRLNDQELAEGQCENDVEIPASGEAVIEMPFTVDLTAIPGVAWNALTDFFTLRYELQTEFTIPLFASLKHTQKTSFKGDLPIGEAFSSLSNRLKEKLFGKP